MCGYLGNFLEGLMQPLGKLTLVGGRFVTPTPPLEAECAMVCFIPSLPATSFAHPFLRPVSQCLAPIKSSTHLKMAWFASSHLCLPPHSLTLPAQGSST